MAQITLSNLTKKFGDVTAVDGIDLAIEDRELLVLVGPSGCGKSTTLRMIAGLDDATSGRIVIGDRDVNHVAPKDRDVAMVFQRYALYPHMNVYKNMAFGLKIRRTLRAEIDTRVRRAAEMLGISGLLDRKPGQLSGGEQQRVAVGRAIVRDPQVFLLDEPLSNLDAQLRVTMRTELVKLQRRLATTMIYVTHDQVEAMTMGDRIAVMYEGRIQQVGPPLDVYDRPAHRFVAELIGSPPINMLPGTLAVNDGGASVRLGEATLPLPDANSSEFLEHPDRKIVFGIRPEDVAVTLESSTGGESSSLAARVVATQLLGADALLELETSAGPLAARVEAHRRPAPESQIVVEMNMGRSHLFDAAIGSRL